MSNEILEEKKFVGKKNVSKKSLKIVFTYVSEHCAFFGTKIKFGYFWREGSGSSACR